MHITKPMARLLRLSTIIKIDDLCEKQSGLSTNKLSCLLADVENEIKQCVYDIKFSPQVQEYRQWQPAKHCLPECNIESEEDHDADGYPQWHGMVSAALEITDGYNYARGHYRNDGSWVIYGAEHDFQIIDQEKITHWMKLPKLPQAVPQK